MRAWRAAVGGGAEAASSPAPPALSLWILAERAVGIKGLAREKAKCARLEKGGRPG